jgi:transposase
MQDGAPGHAARRTQKELEQQNIPPIFWPPFSPDLNPIESLWNKMKFWFQDCYRKETMGHARLKPVVKEAWDRISDEDVLELISSMKERCEAVIEAKGGHTKF